MFRQIATAKNWEKRGVVIAANSPVEPLAGRVQLNLLIPETTAAVQLKTAKRIATIVPVMRAEIPEAIAIQAQTGRLMLLFCLKRLETLDSFALLEATRSPIEVSDSEILPLDCAARFGLPDLALAAETVLMTICGIVSSPDDFTDSVSDLLGMLNLR